MSFTDVFDREERAAIMEFDGGLSREAAECAAGLTVSRYGTIQCTDFRFTGEYTRMFTI